MRALFNPALAMRLLDRYVLRNFLEPFVLCFFGFLAIWLVFDLTDHLGDFTKGGASLKTIITFYATQLPEIIFISLPVGILLALLFSLSKMSRSNEIISMLSAGRSVVRVILPLLVVGLLASLGMLALSYSLVPHAEAVKEEALKQVTESKKKGKTDAIDAHLFRDRQTRRTWFIKKMRITEPLSDVTISAEDEAGNIVRKWYADRATYNARTGEWVLFRGLILRFDSEGNIIKSDSFPDSVRVIKKWSETPERIASATYEPEKLSVPELRNYLVYNADFPASRLAPFRTLLAHRFALPWTCLVVVIFAAPLGIVFSRRGVLAGVASSIFIFFGMLFFTNLFLALGKGARITPWLAAWAPVMVLGGGGLILLYFRATNRDLPSLRFWRAHR